MTHFPPPAEELRLLDAELRQLDARRAQLLARRAWVVTLLQPVGPPPASTPPAAPRAETSAPRVQNVLLLLGGILLTIAAMAFTLVSWGHMGITGRAAVLGTVTALALAAPVPLLRRGLTSTAESVAGLGLALTLLDAYALHEAALTDTDGTAYAAWATAVLAGLWAVYGTAMNALRLPRPAALAVAQLPLLLGAFAADADEYGVTAALLVTAAADVWVALRDPARLAGAPRSAKTSGAADASRTADISGTAEPAEAFGAAGASGTAESAQRTGLSRSSGPVVSDRAVRIVAVIGAWGMGAWGVLAAGRLSWTAAGPSAAAGAAALLIFASAVATGAAWRLAGMTTAAQTAAETPAPSTAPGTLPQGPAQPTTAPGTGAQTPSTPEPQHTAPETPSNAPAPGPATQTPDTAPAPGRIPSAPSNTPVAGQTPGAPGTAPAQGPATGESRPASGFLPHAWGWGEVPRSFAVPPRPSRVPLVVTGSALLAALLLVAAVGGILRVTLPDGWAVPGYLLCAVGLLAVVRGRLPEPLRNGIVWASGSVQSLALLWALPLAEVVVLGPVEWVERPWSGGPADARAALAGHATWPSYAVQALVVLVLVAGVLAVAVREASWRPRALTAAVVLGWAAAVAIPPVLQLPYAVGLVVLGVITATALAAAAYLPASLHGTFPLTGTLLALLTSLDLALLALAEQSATLAALTALALLCAAASARPRLAPLTAPAALVYATGLACATGAAADWQPPHTALLVLAVPAATALLAPRLAAPARLAAEVTGATAGVVAVGLAVHDAPMLALVLALLGVVAAGTAVPEDRRPVGYAAAALFLLATWVRLAAWDVETPEAYTLPVTVPVLLVGAWRRHRDPLASSWTAYGPGLAATLLPSLAAAWGDPDWRRPLLLGIAALLVTLLGARHRLRAPLVLGGSVLVLDALHELAPYLVQAADALPRWVPPALAGLLLLAVGATYEQRLRDVRRVREVLGRMH